MGRSPCCSKVGLRRGPWSTKEDTLLSNFIQLNGEGQWRSLPKKAGLLRCGKSCRLRWMNYLRPGIKRGNINQDEEDLIVRMHGLLGNRWSLIAGRLPGRTDNEIKNYWNTHLLKKLQTAGIHPKSHKDLPKKPPKNTKITDKPEKKKKLLKKKKAGPARDEEKNVNENEGEQQTNDDEVVKTKAYLPKPIRVSPAFARTNSYDSLASGSSSSDGAAEKVADGGWTPLFEDDFMPILPLLHHHSDAFSGEVDMLMEQVYDEYFQLL